MSKRSRVGREMKATWDELCAGDEVAVHEARKLSRNNFV